MPLERWRPGQRIRDRQRISIPPATPPGTYTLYIGAFRGVERLPVTPATLTDGKNRCACFSFRSTSLDRDGRDRPAGTRREGLGAGNARCARAMIVSAPAVETSRVRASDHTRRAGAALAAVALLALVESAVGDRGASRARPAPRTGRAAAATSAPASARAT